LRRAGRKKAPFYKIVAADSRAARDGRFIESLGTYDPALDPAKVELKEDRIFHWLKNGATPTFTVRNILSRKGIMLKLHHAKKGTTADKVTEEHNKWLATQDAKIQKESEKKLERKRKKKKAETEQAAPAAEKTEQPAAAE